LSPWIILPRLTSCFSISESASASKASSSLASLQILLVEMKRMAMM